MISYSRCLQIVEEEENINDLFYSMLSCNMVSILDGRLFRILDIHTLAFLGNHQPSKTEIMFPVNNVEVT